LKGIHKEFDQELYDKFDGPAKDAMRCHLLMSGHKAWIPEEDYCADLHSTYKTVSMVHEVEVSLGWKLGEHPFPLGSIPERKGRLLDKHEGCILFFWMLRLDLKRAVVFSEAHVKERYLVEVPNKVHPEGEFFYRIPKHLGKEFDLLCLP
jgi:hypothetical protein